MRPLERFQHFNTSKPIGKVLTLGANPFDTDEAGSFWAIKNLLECGNQNAKPSRGMRFGAIVDMLRANCPGSNGTKGFSVRFPIGLDLYETIRVRKQERLELVRLDMGGQIGLLDVAIRSQRVP